MEMKLTETEAKYLIKQIEKMESSKDKKDEEIPYETQIKLGLIGN